MIWGPFLDAAEIAAGVAVAAAAVAPGGEAPSKPIQRFDPSADDAPDGLRVRRGATLAFRRPRMQSGAGRDG
jgi:hypothetical protein